MRVKLWTSVYGDIQHTEVPPSYPGEDFMFTWPDDPSLIHGPLLHTLNGQKWWDNGSLGPHD